MSSFWDKLKSKDFSSVTNTTPGIFQTSPQPSAFTSRPQTIPGSTTTISAPTDGVPILGEQDEKDQEKIVIQLPTTEQVTQKASPILSIADPRTVFDIPPSPPLQEIANQSPPMEKAQALMSDAAVQTRPLTTESRTTRRVELWQHMTDAEKEWEGYMVNPPTSRSITPPMQPAQEVSPLSPPSHTDAKPPSPHTPSSTFPYPTINSYYTARSSSKSRARPELSLRIPDVIPRLPIADITALRVKQAREGGRSKEMQPLLGSLVQLLSDMAEGHGGDRARILNEWMWKEHEERESARYLG